MRQPTIILIKENIYYSKHEQNYLKTIKYQLMLKINEKYTDKDRKNQRINAGQCDALFPKKMNAKDPQNRVCDLNCRVSEGYMTLTASAFTAKDQIRDHGDIVVPAELVITRGTMRVGLCNAHFVGHAVYDHVKKASDA